MIVDKDLLVRKIYLVAANVLNENDDKTKNKQINLFDISNGNMNIDYNTEKREKEKEREHNLQNVILQIKEKYGKNAILKGINFEKAGTTIERNKEIGGHKA